MRSRRLATILAAALLLLRPPASASAAPLRVLASFLPMYLFTVNVARGAPGVTVDLLLPADLGCPHDYALTPSDMRKIASADLFIANGMGMEEFLGDPVRKANPRVRTVETASSVPALRGSRARGTGFAEAGETGPRARRRQPAHLGQPEERRPPGAGDREGAAGGVPRQRGAFPCERGRLRAAARVAPPGIRRGVPLLSEEEHRHLPQRVRPPGAGLRLAVVGRVENAPGQEPSAGEIRRLVRTIRDKGVPVLFAEPQYPKRVADVIAREAGIPVCELDPVATGRRTRGSTRRQCAGTSRR
jgi:ABC-type Zn uptake system ZnuABC Zn-binding protein ZnuA